uniref:Uncharacterized protein n=1 Tax=Parascaris equorum TaxID=6256 RepID=A0A914S109_PAREQ
LSISAVSAAVTTALKKQEVNEQIKEKFGDFKENCFPKPSGGCRCNEKDADGNEVVARYDSEADCKVPLPISVTGNRVLTVPTVQMFAFMDITRR